MTRIRVEVASEFRGDTVVLVAMDAAGVEVLAAAVTEAEEAGSAQFNAGDIDHQVLVAPGRADVELRGTNVVWHLDHAKTVEFVELVEKLTVLRESGHPGHHYVDDFRGPAQTLVLSVAE
jgi:hypothetical protein